jgi:hypothetical protein
MSRNRAHLLPLALLAACHGRSPTDDVVIRQSALSEGAITFHLGYDNPSPTIGDRAGGTGQPDQANQVAQVGQGLFGQAELATSPQLTYRKGGNIDLSRPGSLAFWLKPDQWGDVELPLILFDGSRKLMVWNQSGRLFGRIEDWSGANNPAVDVDQGSAATWKTVKDWHLFVVNWGTNSISLSVDGATPALSTVSWLPSFGYTDAGMIYSGSSGGGWPDNGRQSFLMDELIVLNRPMTTAEIRWLATTRATPGVPNVANPALAYFGITHPTTAIEPPQGPITFNLDFESTSPTAHLSGGVATPQQTDRVFQQATPGLFGKALKSTTLQTSYFKKGNSDLSKPGSLAVWIKGDGWGGDHFPVQIFEGGRKLLFMMTSGNVYARMEDWTHGANGSWANAVGGSSSGWATDNQWHLLVAGWGSDYVSFSLDGAPATVTSAPWWANLGTIDEGMGLIVGDAPNPSYLLDELMVLNRPMTNAELQWLWSTRNTPGLPNAANPAIQYFGWDSVCGSAAESQTATLSCPSGKGVARLAFASYGNPVGTCGSYAVGSCNAATSLTNTTNACYGKTSCSVAAADATFGTTCSGTTKQLAMQAVCDTLPASCSSPTVIVSEGSTATVGCPAGKIITNVAFASYGLPSGLCETLSTTSTCHAASSLSTVKAACVGKLSCSVAANNTTFGGDPCSGKAKRLAIQLTCGTCTPTTCVAQGRTCGSIPDGCGGSLTCGSCPGTQICGSGGGVNACGAGACGTVNEGSTTTLSCPAGQKISSIVYASYGTPWGTCGGFVNGACQASGTLVAIQSACLGQATCSVTASNAAFGGDPCPGTAKQLKVQVACAFPDGTPCDDGNLCTLGDVYTNNVCAGTAKSCPAGNACQTATCAPSTGQCGLAPKPAGTSCSDSNVCNGSEVCDGSDTCAAGTPLACDDGNPCTADSCDAVTACMHTPTPGATCSDGNVCTGNDSCDIAGTCQAGANICPSPTSPPDKQLLASDGHNVAQAFAPADHVQGTFRLVSPSVRPDLLGNWDIHQRILRQLESVNQATHGALLLISKSAFTAVGANGTPETRTFFMSAFSRDVVDGPSATVISGRILQIIDEPIESIELSVDGSSITVPTSGRVPLSFSGSGIRTVLATVHFASGFVGQNRFEITVK